MMKNFNELKKELLQKKEVAREDERLKPRYRLISELITARIKNWFSFNLDIRNFELE